MTQAFNIDCMDAMAQMKDNEFDLAIVDPPYGINMGNYQRTHGDKMGRRHKKKGWDESTPDLMYWSLLASKSAHQIVWGGNYYFDTLGNSRGLICWYKHQPVKTYSDCEYAWISIDTTARVFDFPYYGNINAERDRIHPTQKPVALYKWLLKNYAKEGDSILDTHLGSGSSRIAAHDMGFDFVGYEIDKDYFDAQEKRFANHIKQQCLFNPKDMYQ
jgi:site-specific DNA-methyltransferase (adenine-specific)